MNRNVLRASHLAVKASKAAESGLSRAKTNTVWFRGFPASPRSFSAIAQRNLFRQIKPNLSGVGSFSRAIRYCSHQRNMCRAYEDTMSGSVDITKGREILPSNVKPIHYDLTLEPDFEQFTYEGTVVTEYVQ